MSGTQFIIHGVGVDCPEEKDAKVGAWFLANFPHEPIEDPAKEETDESLLVETDAG